MRCRWVWVGITGGLLAHPALAASDDDPSGSADESASEVIVTGTRERGLTTYESVSPISTVTGDELARTGQSSVLQALNALVPSYNLPAFPGGDLSNLVHSARLRGLSPNHTLVLVNGKRRHTSSVVNASPGPAQGSSPADLDLIPVAAVERIEVLADGAAAQYGSDAIAGVINIILKSSPSGGELSATGGSYYKGDGAAAALSANKGLQLGQGGFFDLSADARSHQPSNRTGPDLRITDRDPNVGRILGDPQSRVGTLSYNSGLPLTDDIEAYSFGTYAHRMARSFQNYRLATDIPAPYYGSIYADGYIPRERIDENDYAVSFGVRGHDFNGWRWDLSSTYGTDAVRVGVEDSINISLLQATGSSQTDFRAGNFRASQWTTDLDFSRDIEVGLSSPLTAALGAEYRRDTYELDAGDAASRYEEGTVAYPGFSLTDAGRHHRTNSAVYADLVTKLLPQWKVDVGGRYEHYSDFGSTLTGKLATRYEITPSLALRATVGNGFAAPSLAQQYFSATNVGLNQALVQLPANSTAAQIVGAHPLQPEKSTNLTLGLTFNGIRNLQASFDVYRIDIRHRIVDTGYLIGPQAQAAIIANGNVLGPDVFSAATYFTNAVDTRTQGLDYNLSYRLEAFAGGSLDARLAGNINTTQIRHIDPTPPELISLTSIFDPPAINAITSNAPHDKVSLKLLYRNQRLSVDLRETRYGSLSWVVSPSYVFPPFYDNRLTPKYITDLEVGYRLTDELTAAVGAVNLFGVYPNKTIPASRDRNTVVYNFLSPFGYNGGAYYARLSYRF